jgi:hypothetical protein
VKRAIGIEVFGVGDFGSYSEIRTGAFSHFTASTNTGTSPQMLVAELITL